MYQVVKYFSFLLLLFLSIACEKDDDWMLTVEPGNSSKEVESSEKFSSVPTWSDEFNGSAFGIANGENADCFSRVPFCEKDYNHVNKCTDVTKKTLSNLGELNKCNWKVIHMLNWMGDRKTVDNKEGNYINSLDARMVTIEKVSDDNGKMISVLNLKGMKNPDFSWSSYNCKRTNNGLRIEDNACPIISGAIRSLPSSQSGFEGFTAKYGKFEIRAKFDPKPGMFPAHWLLPAIEGRKWPDDGEIDIMEYAYRNGDNNEVTTTFHTKELSHYGDKTANPTNKKARITYDDFKNWASKFHTFTVEWTPENVKWFIDGMHTLTLTKGESMNGGLWHSDSGDTFRYPDFPFYVILNTTIHYYSYKWGGPVDLDNYGTVNHYIDYIRYYKLKE